MLRQLPENELQKMAAAIQELFRSLSFAASWTVITASLIPKKEITRSLSDVRPISGLCHFRKLLGYLWMDALPSLQWMSPQAGIVRGRQPAEAAFVLTRAELAREWDSPVYVGQLDLRQAFDKIKHSAVNWGLVRETSPFAVDSRVGCLVVSKRSVGASPLRFLSPQDSCATWCASRGA